MPLPLTTTTKLPAWLRWAALLWLAIWIPVYWRAWGGANFLHLCDIAVLLTCIGLWFNSALLISSQAVASLLADAAWALDAASKLFLTHPLVPGIESSFDPRYALWIRLLSLYHLVMPPLLLWAISRIGYDRRGWVLQSAIALPAFVAARFTSPADNINFAFLDPFFHKQIGPAAVHVTLSWLFMVVVAYLPTHALIKHYLRPPIDGEAVGAASR
ncbi:MAG TPA: hypothetical protein VGR97_06860 [Candidatus Acidoferrales bacterium]|nr:hypothetical protein [Candidatus Acidoferrales bacterium]